MSLVPFTYPVFEVTDDGDHTLQANGIVPELLSSSFLPLSRWSMMSSPWFLISVVIISSLEIIGVRQTGPV